ncbi:MAG: hypothetical protein IJC59_05415 [Lachnospiraceae bacterium]|nr:hypothetical protein [Lachnospiraceae bacterium]
MGDNLFKVLIATAKAKITPLVTRIKLWTSWNYISTRVISKIRVFFASLLDIRPRHKRDYYEVIGWLISRRLAFAIAVVLGVVSVYYLITVKDSYQAAEGNEGIRTYDYDSILLRFTSGKVRIKGKSGYLAYEGNVDKGAVTGSGILYSPGGNIVYQGNFDRNLYQGAGTCYYDNGVVAYSGSFEQNLYQGTGKLYRENGSLEYEGEFHRGEKEGAGKLYDTGNNLIYTGNFSSDEVVYSELLGKSTAEAGEMYTGTRSIYESEEELVVKMEQINAMYVGRSDARALDDSFMIEKVFVLENTFGSGSAKCDNIAELNGYFGTGIYEGNSRITLGEAIAINDKIQSSLEPVKRVEISGDDLYTDYSYVDGIQEDYIVYINSYEKDGLIYSFIRDGSEEGFLYYMIEAQEG